MKLAMAAFAALLLNVSPAAPVRYEVDGVRVGGELVSGPALQLKAVDSAALLVSGAAVESLGAPVDVALSADRAVTLHAGLRLERKDAGFLLTSHGAALEVAGLALDQVTSLAFTLTAAGFDFGALGTIDATSFVALAQARRPQDRGIVSPERTGLQNPRLLKRNRVFRNFNPFVQNAGADREVIRLLIPVSPF